MSSAARGLGTLSGRVAGDEEGGVDIKESQGLGTRGLSDSDSPNILPNTGEKRVNSRNVKSVWVVCECLYSSNHCSAAVLLEFLKVVLCL